MLVSQAMRPYLRGVHIRNENPHDESPPFASGANYPEADHAPFLAQFAESD